MLPAVWRQMIRDYGEKRIKAPSLDVNNTEQISLKVGALPHSTLPNIRPRENGYCGVHYYIIGQKSV